jgi:hypothetical protein
MPAGLRRICAGVDQAMQLAFISFDKRLAIIDEVVKPGFGDHLRHEGSAAPFDGVPS